MSFESHLRATGILDILDAELKSGGIESGDGYNESGKLSGKKRKDRSGSNFPLSDLFTESNEGKFLNEPQTKKRSVEIREKIPSKNVRSIFEMKKNINKNINLLDKLELKLQENNIDDNSEEEDDLLSNLLETPKKSEEENLLDELDVKEESSSEKNEKSEEEKLFNELNIKSKDEDTSDESITDEEGNPETIIANLKDIISKTIEKNSPKSSGILDPLVECILRKKEIIDTKDKEFKDFNGLVRAYGVSEDTNVVGMRRSKELLRMTMFVNKRQRYEMQDKNFCSCDLYKDVALFCVFDGHIGSNCSKDLVTLFPNNLIRYLRDIIQSYDDIPHMWGSLFRLVDSKLKEYNYEGSTATTALVWKRDNKRYLICANVGDSTAYLYRGGKPIAISVDHKIIYEYEKERIKAMGVEIEEQQTRIMGLNVSRAFGDHFPKEKQTGMIVDPYVSPVYEITDADTHIIMGSDGLWDVITPDEAYETISDLTDCQAMSHRLLKKATGNNKCQDNVTVIVVSLN